MNKSEPNRLPSLKWGSPFVLPMLFSTKIVLIFTAHFLISYAGQCHELLDQDLHMLME